jgi:hypothetical protein
MEISTAPLEGIVVIVVDGAEDSVRIEKALSHSGAAVFVARRFLAILPNLQFVQSTPRGACIDLSQDLMHRCGDCFRVGERFRSKETPVFRLLL